MRLWPYSTHDEVSHLAETDVEVLRDRIDQLLEERRVLRTAVKLPEMSIPHTWRLTAQEERFVVALVAGKQGEAVTKAKLHTAMCGLEPETAPNLVNVVACKVRAKLKDQFGPHAIETAWGKGFVPSKALWDYLRGPKPI